MIIIKVDLEIMNRFTNNLALSLFTTGLTTLIIGVTNSFSLKFATNIAYNSGINIINTVLYQDIDTTSIPSDLIDVVIIVGGIDSVDNVFDEKLFNYLANLNYSNVVFAGTVKDRDYLTNNIKDLVIVENIINNKLLIVVRYFGGVKLGAGPLLRAYKNAGVSVIN